ncbi:hypothetical protein H0H93_016753 [Arthromyces matolae]|nr:hypothetical protein H0H93_016753 [Arthromyces matolae]
MSSLSCPISDEDHKELDVTLNNSHSPTLDLMRLVVLTTALALDDTNYYPRWKSLSKSIESDDEFKSNFSNIAEECKASGRWKPFRDAEQQQQQRGKSSPDDETIQKSWDSPYIGDTHDFLKKTIINHCLRTDKAEIYSLTLSIVQSSGTGKSRMMDELAKTLPVVFLNTRPPNHDGFPAADDKVRNYLQHEKESYHWFLCALFEVLKEYVDSTLDEKVGEERVHWTFAEKLRYLMTHEQHYSEQGELRTEFYDKVIKKAGALRGKPMSESALFDTVNTLVSQPPFSDELPLILAIDEVHGLETGISGAGFINLQRQLNKIVKCKHIITVFLSTAGKIQTYTPPLTSDPSARRRSNGLRVLPPFTALGFDQLARGMVKENTLMVDEIITDRFMCQFGRPLFGTRYNNGTDVIKRDIVNYAAQKLRGGGTMPKELPSSVILACLASRLALQFNASSLNQQLQQVEQHLRICVTVNEDMETAVTVSASEPILAEASAYTISHFRKQKKMSQMLREILLGTPSLDLGDRGESTGLLLLTMARDAIVYPPEKPNEICEELRSIPLVTFMQKLLAIDNLTEALPTSTDTTRNLPFGEAFKNSRIHFNHFIKVTDSKTINRHFLWKVASRGAGILCADRQLGIDAILVFILDCEKPLGPNNIGIILIQDKNDANYKLAYRGYLYDIMHPHVLGIFEDDKDHCTVIRMVLALASPESGAYVIPPPIERPLREPPTQKFTAYDIWCAGVTKETFPLIGDDDQLFREILQRDSFWPASYKPLDCEPMEIEAVKRSLHPASRGDDGHWSFCEDVHILASAEDTATEIPDMSDTAADEDSLVPQGKKKRKRKAKKRQLNQ